MGWLPAILFGLGLNASPAGVAPYPTMPDGGDPIASARRMGQSLNRDIRRRRRQRENDAAVIALLAASDWW